jgi:protein phosphatase
MPDLKLVTMKFAGESHIGLVRSTNEDSFCYCAYPEDINYFAVVADGIGGHESGDVASRMCCRGLIRAWQKHRLGQEKSEKKIIEFLDREITQVNREIHRLNVKQQRSQPMGTTVIAVVFGPKTVISAHAGDSRLYRYRGGKIERLTEDHSFVAALIKKNIISDKEAESHPFSHIIMKSVGPTDKVDPEINVYHRENEDKFLLCSDGLTIHVKDYRMEKMLAQHHSPKAAVNQLMKASLIGGGDDNVTVICAFPRTP